MKIAVVTLCLALVGCAQSTANRSILGVSLIAIACDYGQTRAALAEGGVEANPILGRRPSVEKLTIFNAILLAAVTGGYLLVGETHGEDWQWTVPGSHLLIETITINHNAIVSPKPLCGLR